MGGGTGGWAGMGTYCHLLAVQFFQPTKTTSQSLDGLFDLCERVAVSFLALEQAGTVFLGGEISPEFSRGAFKRAIWMGRHFFCIAPHSEASRKGAAVVPKESTSLRSWEGMIWCSWLLLR